MEETFFKPKYPLAQLLGIVFLPLMEGFLLVQLFVGKTQSIELAFATIFIGVILLFVPRMWVKCITFGTDSFVINSYLLPAKTINYSDVIDLGNLSIKTRHGSIPLRPMKNARELQSIFGELAKRGRINIYQLEGKLAAQEIISIQATLLAAVISFVLYLIAYYLDLLPHLGQFFSRLSYLLFFLPVYMLVYAYLKRRVE